MDALFARYTKKVESGVDFSKQEVVQMLNELSLSDWMHLAHQMRMKKHNNQEVTFIIDRNVNITNVCISGCMFCNYYRGVSHKDAYVIGIDDLKPKIDALKEIGGRQLLIQGGLHPKLGLSYYKNLFQSIKAYDHEILLHALGPPEIAWISQKEGISYHDCLKELASSGLDSLPGAGAEILSDRVREIISPKKCTTQEWLAVMKAAHSLNITTSATMMFGHIETPEERLDHLFFLKVLQSDKPKDAIGFVSFTPWPVQLQNTRLQSKYQIDKTGMAEYIKWISISRVVLSNIDNIQASWLTTGKKTGQIALHAGANDLGSVMMEENVVSAAGCDNRIQVDEMENMISEAGFIPVQRDQQYKKKVAP